MTVNPLLEIYLDLQTALITPNARLAEESLREVDTLSIAESGSPGVKDQFFELRNLLKMFRNVPLSCDPQLMPTVVSNRTVNLKRAVDLLNSRYLCGTNKSTDIWTQERLFVVLQYGHRTLSKIDLGFLELFYQTTSEHNLFVNMLHQSFVPRLELIVRGQEGIDLLSQTNKILLSDLKDWLEYGSTLNPPE